MYIHETLFYNFLAGHKNVKTSDTAAVHVARLAQLVIFVKQIKALIIEALQFHSVRTMKAARTPAVQHIHIKPVFPYKTIVT
jgi:hypothetical protein